MEEETADSIVIGWRSAGRYSSDVWKSFDRIIVDGKQKAKCKQCGATYVYAGTTNLKRHIAGTCPYREHVVLPVHLQQQQQQRLQQLPKTEPADPPMNSTVPPAHDNNGSVPLARDNNGSPPITSAQEPVNPPTNSTVPPARDNNGSPPITSSQGSRIGEVERVTKETNVHVKINLDGDAVAENNTGIPFLDHMLDQLASHGLFDVHVNATGDIYIDDHHTNEDVALAIGTALLQALGDKKGINRFGDVSSPLNEALVHVSLDLSGRPHLNYGLSIPTQRVGNYDTQLVEHFFQSLVNTSGMTLHIRQLAGRNSHHIIEATFMAFARALRLATEYDPRRRGSVPSSNGCPSHT